MKFRTDFVTNSSSSSFMVFNVKNQKLYDFLTELGINIEDTEYGVFDPRMTVTTPSGEELDLYEYEADFFPSTLDTSSISSWIMSLLLFEVEEVWPSKEIEDYSEFTLELLELLKEKGIVNFDLKAPETLSRDNLLPQLSYFDDMDKETEEANIEFNTGFEGEILGLEVTTSKNGYSLTINCGDCGCFDPESPSELNVFILDPDDTIENKSDIIRFIEDNGGTICNEISKDTDFVICDNIDEYYAKSSQDFGIPSFNGELKPATDFCIPVISANGFMLHFNADGEMVDENDYDFCEMDTDLIDELFDCTFEGNYYDLFYQYGMGSITRISPKN